MYYANEICEIELLYNNHVPFLQRFKINNSRRVVELFHTTYDKNKLDLQETFKAAYFNHANELLGILTVGSGATAGCLVDLKFILGTAIKANASAIIICHNHPSGQLTPSQADIMLTNRIFKACQLFDIRLLDHVIITSNKLHYYSFCDDGKQPFG